mmetsp:Transcript_22483/g.45523  ORF Transcript_22483/g.45523 Transcript_22483/m.45523 type:complete len:242 (-) Transcript_22483:114-839(-)
MSDSLNCSEHGIPRIRVQFQSSRVQQSKHRRLALGVALQSIHHGSHLFVYDFTLGRPHDREDADGRLHFGAGRRVNVAVRVHVASVSRPPSLKVEASVGIFGIDGVPEGGAGDVGECLPKSQTGLGTLEVGSANGTNDRTTQDVILVVDGFVDVPRRLLDVVPGFGQDVKGRFGTVEFEVFEHGGFGFGTENRSGGFEGRGGSEGFEGVECARGVGGREEGQEGAKGNDGRTRHGEERGRW